ncbi:MAG: recombinase family protein [Clostridia bacterium]|nr:recombinase family protein [Clostridia bacterium]
MKVAIYLRKSRAEEHLDTAEVLQRHREQLLALAKSKGYTVVKIYEEVVSGGKLEMRPQMLNLLDDVLNGLYDAVLCMDIDRLGRGSMSEQGLIMETFQESETLIVTPDKVHNLSDESDETAVEFEAFIARMEYKKIAKRMKVGKIKTIRDGYCLSEPSYGYERDYINGRPTLKVNEEQAKIVKMIFSLYTVDHLGCQRIANYLNSLSVKTRKGTPFTRTSVRHILKNETYIGNVIYNRINYTYKNGKKVRKKVNSREDWIVGKGTFPKLITEEQFAKAQELMKQNSSVSLPHEKSANNPMAGIIVCGKCGRNMQKQGYKQNGSNVLLYCVNPGCQRGNRFDYVEAEILKQLREFLDTEFEGENNFQNASDDNIDKVDVIDGELKKLFIQKENLHNLLEQGVYDIETFVERNKVISDRIDTLHQELQTCKKGEAVIDYAATKERIRYVLSIYDSSNISDKNVYMKSILEKVVYNKEKHWSGSSAFELGIYIKYSYVQ